MQYVEGLFSNYMHYEVWGEITYRFRDFNSAAVEVWEWISNYMWTIMERT